MCHHFGSPGTELGNQRNEYLWCYVTFKYKALPHACIAPLREASIFHPRIYVYISVYVSLLDGPPARLLARTPKIKKRALWPLTRLRPLLLHTPAENFFGSLQNTMYLKNDVSDDSTLTSESCF